MGYPRPGGDRPPWYERSREAMRRYIHKLMERFDALSVIPYCVCFLGMLLLGTSSIALITNLLRLPTVVNIVLSGLYGGLISYRLSERRRLSAELLLRSSNRRRNISFATLAEPRVRIIR
jgi:hypothetical protein